MNFKNTCYKKTLNFSLAAGFKLSLLTKIHEIKSNKPRMTMMHVLVESIEKNKPELLQFYKKFDDITEVAKWVLTFYWDRKILNILQFAIL